MIKLNINISREQGGETGKLKKNDDVSEKKERKTERNEREQKDSKTSTANMLNESVHAMLSCTTYGILTFQHQ